MSTKEKTILNALNSCLLLSLHAVHLIQLPALLPAGYSHCIIMNWFSLAYMMYY